MFGLLCKNIFGRKFLELPNLVTLIVFNKLGYRKCFNVKVKIYFLSYFKIFFFLWFIVDLFILKTCHF